MKQAVIVKGNINKGTKGITVILDSELAFENLKIKVKEKFQELSDFLKESKMVVCFEGRELSVKEQQILLDIITENSKIKVLYLLDADSQKESMYSEKLEQIEQEFALQEQKSEAESMFYKGTLRSGQVVESESSVIIIGDVNPGGKVISGGNVIVLGALKGIACAGITGNRQAFVVAMEMKPMQIRIANIVAKCGDVPVVKGRLRRRKAVDNLPKIAILREDNIFIENLDKEAVASLSVSQHM